MLISVVLLKSRCNRSLPSGKLSLLLVQELLPRSGPIRNHQDGASDLLYGRDGMCQPTHPALPPQSAGVEPLPYDPLLILDVLHLLEGAKFQLPQVDRINAIIRCLHGNPMPVSAFVKPQAIVGISVTAIVALVDRGAVEVFVCQAVPEIILADLEKKMISHRIRLIPTGYCLPEQKHCGRVMAWQSWNGVSKHGTRRCSVGE